MNITSLLAAIEEAERIVKSPAVRAAEAHFAVNEAMMRRAEKYMTVADSIQKCAEPFIAQQAALDAFAASHVAQVSAIESAVASFTSPTIELRAHIEDVAKRYADQEAALQEMVARCSPPAPLVEPSYPSIAWGPVVIPAPRYRAMEEQVEPELPERTIIRREVTRRVGFARYEDE